MVPTQVKTTHEPIGQLAQELERTRKEFEQFAYAASHDLREPLRMVSSYLQLLDRRYNDVLDERAREFIGFAVDGARRMQSLIDGLMIISRLVTKPVVLTSVGLESALRSALDSLRETLNEHGACVTHDPLPEVMADEEELTQLFTHIIDNAAKFKSASPPAIHVGVAPQEPPFVELFVRDNGIGIDRRAHERVFTVFQRLHGRDDYPGTGMGLTLCKTIVERHGGRIWVESAAGEGCSVHFTLKAANHMNGLRGSAT